MPLVGDCSTDVEAQPIDGAVRDLLSPSPSSVPMPDAWPTTSSAGTGILSGQSLLLSYPLVVEPELVLLVAEPKDSPCCVVVERSLAFEQPDSAGLNDFI